jgi:hypothetical protein
MAKKITAGARTPRSRPASATADPVPVKAVLRAYRVGFGDCFLLTFEYSAGKPRHVLIDFGTTRLPERCRKKVTEFHLEVAERIAIDCGNKLDMVVATHRHKDHISGFATGTKGDRRSGDVIRDLDPELVVLPWTEDPEAPVGATAPHNAPGAAVNAFHISGLAAMQSFAGQILKSAEQKIAHIRAAGKHKRVPRDLERLRFLGDDNLSNKSAVENLITLGKKRVFAAYGTPIDLTDVLPGVSVRVLGPPTLKQSDAIRRQRATDASEFWQLQDRSFHSNQLPVVLFPNARRTAQPPAYATWITDRIDRLDQAQTLQIVRILDDAMNNTSLILLFEANGKKLLFPGDAQIENWSYALFEAEEAAENQKLLASVDLYKVGHHGSLNATPKTLWGLFENRCDHSHDDGGNNGGTCLKTVVSTRPGVHGNSERRTEVPRKSLLEALEAESEYHSTEKSNGVEPGTPVEISIDLTEKSST